MKKNPIQFAVVREDPQIEMDIVEEFRLTRATLIGSGGCTAFCLKSLNPKIEIALIEPNPAQIGLIREKIERLKNSEGNELFEKFGVGKSNENSLIECGNFESLFRQFRLFIFEFIAPETEFKNSLAKNSPQFWRAVFAHSYWKVAFELFFSDAFLTAMFTKSAIQHAPQNSYPRYFQTVFERGLTREDAPQNYFLHHIFLGRYLNDAAALPYYLVNLPANLDFEFFNGFAQDFRAFKGRQLVHFSNIFDWCDKAVVTEIINSASANLEKGSVVTLRQLNNDKDYRGIFGRGFEWLPAGKIIEKDRSLFYSKIEIGRKII